MALQFVQMPDAVRILQPANFPPLLAEISDAPKRLYVHGELPSHDEYKYLCVVGSRGASIYGRRVCQSIIVALRGYPIVIVSGLAIGMDTEAHNAALAAGLRTVAVLPAGVGEASVYPRLNRQLSQQIVSRGGALVSEHQDGTLIGRWSFPARDRLMAGLSHATLIVEAHERSGTLITARLTLEYNRELMAIPHALGSDAGAGTNRLIREGAALIRSGEDILEVLGIRRFSGEERSLPADLTETEVKIFAALSEPLDKDSLIEKISLPVSDTNIAISSLLIRGLINERLGKIERV